MDVVEDAQVAEAVQVGQVHRVERIRVANHERAARELIAGVIKGIDHVSVHAEGHDPFPAHNLHFSPLIERPHG